MADSSFPRSANGESVLLPNAYFISEAIGHLRESGSTGVQKAEYGGTKGSIEYEA